MLYEFLDHTADIKFRAYGKDMNEAYANAALALSAILKNPDEVQGKVEKELETSAEDPKALLYDWLEELLILRDTDRFILHEVEVEITKRESEAWYLKAKMWGDILENYSELGTDVKAITYHDMEVKEEPNQWMVQVVVDI